MAMPPQFLKKAAAMKMAKGSKNADEAEGMGDKMGGSNAMKMAISRKLAKRKNK